MCFRTSGKLTSPGCKYKTFTSFHSDLIFTWNYELGSSGLKIKWASIKMVLLNVRASNGQRLVGVSDFELVTSNNKIILPVIEIETTAAQLPIHEMPLNL